jgi:hypothetical protein
VEEIWEEFGSYIKDPKSMPAGKQAKRNNKQKLKEKDVSIGMSFSVCLVIQSTVFKVINPS